MTTWLTVAKQLPLGQKSRIDCPECGANTNTNAMIISHGVKAYSGSCFACGYNPFQMKGIQSLAELAELKRINNESLRYSDKPKLPEDFTTDIPRHGRMWLYKCGLTPTIWKRYGIGYSDRLQRVVLPIYDDQGTLVWYQCRALLDGQKPKYLQPRMRKNGVLFQSRTNVPYTEPQQAIVVTEDIMSTIRVGESHKACSILGTKIDTLQINRISKFSEVITWLDSDKAGRQGAIAIRKAVSLFTNTRDILTPLDPKCYSNKQIQEILKCST